MNRMSAFRLGILGITHLVPVSDTIVLLKEALVVRNTVFSEDEAVAAVR
jgi:hypothetical protein